MYKFIMLFLIPCLLPIYLKACVSKACLLIGNTGLCMKPLTDCTVQPSEWMGQFILRSREGVEDIDTHFSPTGRCDEVSGGLVIRLVGLIMTGVEKLKARSALYHCSEVTQLCVFH